MGDKYDIVCKRNGGDFFMDREANFFRKRDGSIKFGSIAIAVVLSLFVVGTVVYGAVKINKIYSQVKTNWEEIKFAYDKPVLVKAIRTQYETKQLALDASFTQEKKTAEQELIEAVADKVKESPKK